MTDISNAVTDAPATPVAAEVAPLPVEVAPAEVAPLSGEHRFSTYSVNPENPNGTEQTLGVAKDD